MGDGSHTRTGYSMKKYINPDNDGINNYDWTNFIYIRYAEVLLSLIHIYQWRIGLLGGRGRYPLQGRQPSFCQHPSWTVSYTHLFLFQQDSGFFIFLLQLFQRFFHVLTSFADKIKNCLLYTSSRFLLPAHGFRPRPWQLRGRLFFQLECSEVRRSAPQGLSLIHIYSFRSFRINFYFVLLYSACGWL